MADTAARRQVGYLMDEWLRAFSWVALFMGGVFGLVWVWGLGTASDSNSILLSIFAAQVAFVGAAYYPCIVLFERWRGTTHAPVVWILSGIAIYLAIYTGSWLKGVEGFEKLEEPALIAPLTALAIALIRIYRR